ncbi:MAG: MFS transporter [Gammaproteobacteria bacterium]
MIYLLLQGRGTVPAMLFPLLFVGTATVYLILALPAGHLADRWGRHRVFLAGQGLVLGIYGLLLAAELSVAGIVACVAALAGSVLQKEHLTTGLAILGTTTALSRLFASSLFGALWSWRGPTEALVLFGLGLLFAAVLAAVLLRVARPWAPATAK